MEENENKSINIAAIYISQGFLFKSIEKYLTADGITVNEVKANTGKLDGVSSETDAIIIFADGEAKNWRDTLIMTRDRALDLDIPMFVIQGDMDTEDINNTFPINSVTHMYLRPVNVREASMQIIEYISNHGKRTKKKILVVDDSGAMLRNVKGWLGEKYHVIPANSGAMAIKYLSMDKPDLVLLDYEMPVVNGKQVLEMIRTESDFSSVPVIFLTGKNDRESIMDVLALKPEGYLLKTMKPGEIIAAVDDFFAKRENEEKLKRING